MSIKEMVANKLMSGRFWLVMMFGFTICMLAQQEPTIRDAFMALAGGVVRDYFGRGDRANEQVQSKGSGKVVSSEGTQKP